MTPNAEAITAALKRLGDTADDVERSLRVMGVDFATPSADRSRHCPLAQYLRREFSTSVVAVYAFTAYVGDEGKEYSHRLQTVHLPRACVEFVARFDSAHPIEVVILAKD